MVDLDDKPYQGVSANYMTIDDKLTLYRQKRDPNSTNEPFEGLVVDEGETHQGAFVVHLHDATRRHYDLRIEASGVLESFAVPKGPTFDTSLKRLAIHTEAHPLSYLHFEAVIPEGNYGAGPMIIWDVGSIRYPKTSAEAGLAQGKLEFELFGEKLAGRFVLIRTSGRKGSSWEGSQEAWLLIKKKDNYANTVEDVTESLPNSVFSTLGVDELASSFDEEDALLSDADACFVRNGVIDPQTLRPMQPGVVREVEEFRSGWLFHHVPRGGRALIFRRGEEIHAQDTNGGTIALPQEISRALRSLVLSHFVLDGYLVEGERRSHFYAADLLGIANKDIRSLPLSDRLSFLGRVIKDSIGIVRKLIYEEDCSLVTYEVLAKRADSSYEVGPDRDWQVVAQERIETFIGKEICDGRLQLFSYREDDLVPRGSATTADIEIETTDLPQSFQVRHSGYLSEDVIRDAVVVESAPVEVAYVTSAPLKDTYTGELLMAHCTP